MFQHEQLKVYIEGITPTNGLIVACMDYPENAMYILDCQEQQSDYYDRYA